MSLAEEILHLLARDIGRDSLLRWMLVCHFALYISGHQWRFENTLKQCTLDPCRGCAYSSITELFFLMLFAFSCEVFCFRFPAGPQQLDQVYMLMLLASSEVKRVLGYHANLHIFLSSSWHINSCSKPCMVRRQTCSTRLDSRCG